MRRADFLLTTRQVLLKRRDALRRSLDSELALLGRDEDVTDECDDAQDAADDALFSRLAQTESHELTAIEKALHRIREGQYGVCEVCGQTIPLVRLRAIPYATMCIKCQREQEYCGRKDGCFADWTRVKETGSDDDVSLDTAQLMLS